MSRQKAINILDVIPYNKEFRVGEIADLMYPHLSANQDTEGRVFNRGTSTVARLLRKEKNIFELRNGVFYAYR